MQPEGTLLLKRTDVAALLDLDTCIAAVEQALRFHAEGKAPAPGILGMPARGGGFHIKAANLALPRPYFAVKTNGNFFENTKRFGLPNIQGIIMLCDGENGYPLAVMDSIEITILRTGAATAVAARYLARTDAKTATLYGCGNQGRVQLRALARVRRLERVCAFDTDQSRAEQFARELSIELGIPVRAVREPGPAAQQSEVVITCTPSRRYFLRREDVAPGTFVAAVGADSEDKQELDPALLAASKIVTDITDQCTTIGELHHAIEQGLLTRASVHAELGEVLAGRKAGRESASEITVFDSTGTALQDVAAAVIVYEEAVRMGRGARINFAG